MPPYAVHKLTYQESREHSKLAASLLEFYLEPEHDNFMFSEFSINMCQTVRCNIPEHNIITFTSVRVSNLMK
jgi:hypothetical protein